MAFLYYEDFFEVLEETYQDIYDGKYFRLNRNVIQTGKGGKRNMSQVGQMGKLGREIGKLNA